MSSIHYKSAEELVHLIKTGELSPPELMAETLKRIEAVNPVLNGFVALRADEAMKEAESLADDMASGGETGPLAGIPIGVKDLEDVRGMITSYGSVPYRDNMAREDSIQVQRLKGAGAIVVGKTNTPEFGFTGFTKNRLFGVSRNPWNTDRTPGGSSGGSAAAVAGGMVPIATGSDAGGSIRIPASYSGCFGIKPTTGRIPLGPSPLLQMFHIVTNGPLTRTVKDAALYLDATAGYHPSDPLSLPRPERSYVSCLENIPKDLRIAFSPDYGYARVQKDVMACVNRAVKIFEGMGHHVDLCKWDLPDPGDAWAKLTGCVLYSELHQDLEEYREEMGRTFVYAQDVAGSYSVMDLIDAQRVRTGVNQFFMDLFENFDLLLTPTMPTEAFAAIGPPPSEIEGHPLPPLGPVAFTYPINLSGHPAASVPAGLTESGLPSGLQIIGPRHRDDRVLQMAYAYEQARPWNDKWPLDLQPSS